eukprot:gene4117-14221_t
MRYNPPENPIHQLALKVRASFASRAMTFMHQLQGLPPKSQTDPAKWPPPGSHFPLAPMPEANPSLEQAIAPDTKTSTSGDLWSDSPSLPPPALQRSHSPWGGSCDSNSSGPPKSGGLGNEAAGAAASTRLPTERVYEELSGKSKEVDELKLKQGEGQEHIIQLDQYLQEVTDLNCEQLHTKDEKIAELHQELLNQAQQEGASREEGGDMEVEWPAGGELGEGEDAQWGQQ